MPHCTYEKHHLSFSQRGSIIAPFCYGQLQVLCRKVLDQFRQLGRLIQREGCTGQSYSWRRQEVLERHGGRFVA